MPRRRCGRRTWTSSVGHGWSDAAISDAIQVIAYFNYINRVADAVGIDDEPEWTADDDPA